MNQSLLKVLNQRQADLGLSRYRIGKMARLTQRTVDRIMDGETDPHVCILERLTEALGLEVTLAEAKKRKP